MNRFILLSTLLLLSCSTVFAQDTIFSRKYEPLIGAVKKTDRKMVYIQLQYKPKTSLFSIKKSQVEYIHYADGKIELINPVVTNIEEVENVKQEIPSPSTPSTENKNVPVNSNQQDSKSPYQKNNEASAGRTSGSKQRYGIGLDAIGLNLAFEYQLLNPQFSLEGRVSFNPGGKPFENYVQPSSQKHVSLPENQNLSYSNDLSIDNNNVHQGIQDLFSISLNYYISPTPSKLRPFASIALGFGSMRYYHSNTQIEYENTTGPDGAQYDHYNYDRTYVSKSSNGLYYSAGIGLMYQILPRLSLSARFEIYSVDYQTDNRKIILDDKSGNTSSSGFENTQMVYSDFFFPFSVKFSF